ncbi:hypothetical protein RF11_09570 [Thelohanellus kitauei]|uniref:Uncharacterized protein n=1 Tax=Thelohanellus kitauei TaxID=669202 RepID=A0A0C2MW37_THEKT|nr:hypothetical protein RF11_09570 [Thelohanellus kitauei]
MFRSRRFKEESTTSSAKIELHAPLSYVMCASNSTHARAEFITQENLPKDVLGERLSDVMYSKVEIKYLYTTEAQTHIKKQYQCMNCIEDTIRNYEDVRQDAQFFVNSYIPTVCASQDK